MNDFISGIRWQRLQPHGLFFFVKFQVAGFRTLQCAATWKRSNVIVQAISFWLYYFGEKKAVTKVPMEFRCATVSHLVHLLEAIIKTQGLIFSEPGYNVYVKKKKC